MINLTTADVLELIKALDEVVNDGYTLHPMRAQRIADVRAALVAALPNGGAIQNAPFLEEIASKLTAAGWQAFVEYPGVVSIPTDDGAWWFGTANGPWAGDLMIDGAPYKTRETSAPGSSSDADEIALAIEQVLLAEC
jgi:hypothetical protein